jgi:CRP/FNR family transcriptional regulator, cyclic AMP receptor protein
MADCTIAMSTFIQSEASHENTGRTFNAQGMFNSVPGAVRDRLRASAVRRNFAPGQLIQNRGDILDGFWLIEKGQVKAGHYRDDGEMQVLLILGSGDSFGELACLGGYPRVTDAESLGKSELLWISDKDFSEAIASSPAIAREMLRAISVQLQEALDNLLVLRRLPASKRLARYLLALARGRAAPATLSIRHQELAELVGVSRMTIATTLTHLETLGLLERHYRKIILPDPDALRVWMLH